MKKHKRKINLIILFIVIGLVMYFAFKDDFSGVINQLVNIKITYLILGIVFLLLSWLFRSIIFYRLVKRFNANYKFSSSLSLRILTHLFDAITPNL